MSKKSRRHRSTEERGLRDLLELAPDAMVVVDQAGVIVLVNAQAERLFGYPQQEVLGHHVEVLIPHRFRERHLGLRINFSTAPRVRPMGAKLQLFALRKNGSEFPVEISLSPVKTAEGMLVASAIRDVSELKRAEESRLQLAAIVESSDDAIYSKTLDGAIVSWNAGAQQIYGYTEAEAVGKPITILVPPELRDEENKILERLRAGERIEHYETLRITKAGRRINISLSLSPIKDSTGTMLGICGIGRDITERKLADERLREYERAVENAEEMIGVIDREYRFLLANRQYLKLRNLTREQVVGHSIPEVLGAEIFETVIKPKLDECFQGKVVRYEMKFSYPAIGERDLLLSYFPIEGVNGVDRAACIVHDITDRKRAEEELSGLTRKLIEAQEHERARIARELHDDINQRVAMLAIEIERLERRPEAPSEIRDTAHEISERIKELSTDIQALSHELHSSKLEYLGIVGGMKSWCREFGERQGMQIEFKHSGSFSSLPSQTSVCLFRVLQEALHNSAKHSGVKNVDVQLRTKPGEVQLIVHDRGKGFDVAAAMQGRGLGVTSMLERVRLLGGTATIDSKLHGGTTIYARIPLEAYQAQQAGL